MKLSGILTALAAVLAILAALACGAAATPVPEGDSSPSVEAANPTSAAESSSMQTTPTAVFSPTHTRRPSPTPRKTYYEMGIEACERFINDNRRERGEEPIRFRADSTPGRLEGTLIFTTQHSRHEYQRFVYTISKDECEVFIEDESLIPTFTSISVGTSYTCGVRTNSTVECWESGYRPQAGTKPSGWMPEGTFTSVSVGIGNHICGVRTDGSVECWSETRREQLEPPEGSFSYISVGWGFACGVKQDSSIVCWGSNNKGKATPPEGSFSSVDASAEYACGVDTDGFIACWGNQPVVRNIDSKPWAVVARTSLEAGAFISVTASGGYYCGIKTDGSVVCWGFGGYGQASPPEGPFTSISAGGTQTYGVRPDGSVVCWGACPYLSVAENELGDCGIKPIDSDGSVVCLEKNGAYSFEPASFASISSSPGYTCGLKTNGHVVCWGMENRRN